MAHRKHTNLFIPAVIIGLVFIIVILYSSDGTNLMQGLLGKTQSSQKEIAAEKKTEEEGDHQEYNEPVAKSTVHVVDIYADRLEPSIITVGVNDTIAWKNEDSIPHGVAADNGVFDTGEIDVMQQLSAVSYSEPGMYTYTSKTRPSLKGTIIVTE